MAVKLSVLVSARKDSKYLAKFLFGYFARTNNFRDTEILVMTNKNDTWNDELKFLYKDRVKFFEEDYGYGRHGLHIYLNDLIPYANGDWLIYFCEDHFIIKDGWDQKIRQVVSDNELNPKMVHTIVPKFDNAGAMNQIVSRGFVNVLGRKLGNHGWIDSYINDVNEKVFGHHSDRVWRMDLELFHDFTHDHPNPMEAGVAQSYKGLDGQLFPKHNSEEYQNRVLEDAMKIKTALEGGL